jgi:hypothetical protein
VTSGDLGRRKVLNKNLVTFLTKMDKQRVCKGGGAAFEHYARETAGLVAPPEAAKAARRSANCTSSGRSIVAAGLNRAGEPDTLVEEWPSPSPEGSQDTLVLRSVDCQLLCAKKQRCTVCTSLSTLWSRRNDKAKERATGKRASTSTTQTATSLQMVLEKEKKKTAAAKRQISRRMEKEEDSARKRQMTLPSVPPPHSPHAV